MKLDIIRAWKDDAYRQSLSDEQRTELPANPAGELQLTDAQLEEAFGGDGAHIHSVTIIICDLNVVSAQIITLGPILSPLSPTTQVCNQND
jgi:mersacidin/lichenicidin family type 2 lantibiotic